MKRIIVIFSSFNFFIFSFCLPVGAQEYRDVVFLKNGSVIKGFYKEMVAGDSLHISTLDGSNIIVPYSDIQRIAKEKTDVYVIKEAEMTTERKWRPRGYQGFIDVGYGVYLDNTKINYTTFSTVHGYQFNRHLFLGLGLSLTRYQYKYDKYIISPQNDSFCIFADGRWYVLHSRIAPFVDLRCGYDVIGDKALDTSCGAGVDFAFSPRFGIFACINYNYFRMQNPEQDMSRNQNYLNICIGFHF